MPVTAKVNGSSNSLVHKGSNGISAATMPDVCKTPSPGGPVPIPYPNISQSTTLDKGTTTVTADGGMMIAIKGSEFSMSNGDNPGTLGGVKSSTFMKESTWILYSFDVKMEGSNACRLTDKKFQNHENTADMSGVVQTIVAVEAPDELECGALGAYGDQQDVTGDGSLHRDHVPSKKALFTRAAELIKPMTLTQDHMDAIEKSALSIVIPADVHRGVSKTSGGRNSQIMDDDLKRYESDANDLQGAAERDTKAIHDDLKTDRKDCAKEYAKSARKVKAITNDQYDEWLIDVIGQSS